MTDAPRFPREDPRLTPIEQNMLSQFGVIARSGEVTPVSADDVLAFHSTFPLAMFNFIGGARFGDDPARVRARTEEVLEEFLSLGQPFMWWPTPTTTTPAMEEALLGRGMETEASTGMYARLPASPIDPKLPEGLRLELGAEAEPFGLAMATGFDVPPHFGPLLGTMFSVFPPADMLKVVVRDENADDSDPVACGALYVTDRTAGIYCVAVRPSHRRRGVATAITRVLTNIGGFQSCTEVVLHATADAVPLYRRLGFETVCEMPQYSWYPPQR